MKNWFKNLLESILSDWKSEKRDKLKADKSVFNQILEILPQEKIESFVDDVFNGYYTSRFLKNLDEYSRFCQKQTSVFFDKKTEGTRIEFNSAFNELLNFLVTHFFRQYPDRGVFALYPEMKNNGDAEKRQLFNDRLEELREILDNFKNKYNNFLKIIKQRLVKHNRFDTWAKKIFVILLTLLIIVITILLW